MENISNIDIKNTRILIGQNLGEAYLVVQRLIDNKWKSHPKSIYRGNYHVNKKIKALLKHNIDNVRKNTKNDFVKFKVAGIYVYVNDYSQIKNLPEFKTLNDRLALQMLSQKMVLIKNKPIQASSDQIIRIVCASALSLGIIGVASNLEVSSNVNAQYLANSSVISNEESYSLDLSQTVDNSKIIQSLTNQVISNHKTNDNFVLINVPEQETILDKLEDIDVVEPVAYAEVSEDIIEEEVPAEQLENNWESNQNMILNDNINSVDLMIQNYARIYFMDVDTVANIYYDNYDTIINSSNPEQTFLILVKDEFYNTSWIDKTPIQSDMTSADKEQCIIDIATNIYKIEDQNTLILLLAIHRLESGRGTSELCTYKNNPGGLREGNDFLSFKTFEIGAESFVRNVQKNINNTYNMDNYNYDVSFEENMQEIYCQDGSAWGQQVRELEAEIVENNELDNYLDNGNKIYKIKK